MPRPVYVSPTMLKRWVAGRRYPGIWWQTPAGRLRLILPLGRRVTSVYGPGVLR